jgi:hypothetical protein
MSIPIATFIIICPILSFCQTVLKNHEKSASFSCGIAWPIEEFGNNISENRFPASRGQNIKLDLTHHLINKVFAEINFRYILNPLSTKDQPPIFLSDKRTVHYQNNNHTSWKNLIMLIGPSYRLNFNKFRIDIKIKSGVIFSSEPSFDIIYRCYFNENGYLIDPIFDKPYINSTKDELTVSDGKQTSGLAFETGSSLYYTLTKRWHIFFDTDFTFANLKFGHDIKEISILSTNIGITYNFIKSIHKSKTCHPRFRK